MRRALRHPDVLPLIGAIMSWARFEMVSDWMINGNINKFVEKHPNVNRLELTGLPCGTSLSFTSSLLTVGQRIQSLLLHRGSASIKVVKQTAMD